MKKKTIINTIAAAAMMLLPMAAQAQTSTATASSEVQYLVVTDTAGTETKFALADEPVITYSSGNIIVASASDTLETSLAGLKDYSFKTERVVTPTGISDIHQSENVQPQVSFANAEISGLKAGVKVGVYSINGSLVKSVIAGVDGKAAIQLNDLPQGVYILRTPTKSFKIINR